MASVSYSLKNGINRTNNPTTGGVFTYGSYTSAGVFTLFPNYQYSDGTAFVAEPFDSTKPLVWKGGSEYPHLGFENLTPNLDITPQPFPSFGIYLHPFVSGDTRYDVGVRVVIPFGGNIAIASTIQKADSNCGDDVGYRIIKNGIAIQSRQFVNSSGSSTTINTPVNTFVAGDIIDFIVDAGSQNNYFCDDVALEITLTYQYTKIPSPTILPSVVLCSTTAITGTTAYLSEGTIATLYDGIEVIASTSVILDPVLYNGTFAFNGLNLTEKLGKSLSIVLAKSGDTSSDPVFVIVQDGGCVSKELLAPVITKIDLCDTKCDYQRVLSGITNKNGDVIIFKYPYTLGDPIIATGFSTNQEIIISSSNIDDNQKYVAFLVSYDGLVGGQVQITNVSCDTACSLVGVFQGTVQGVTNGIIKVFNYPVTTNSVPVVTSIIKNGVFDIKSTLLAPDTDYVLMAIQIN